MWPTDVAAIDLQLLNKRRCAPSPACGGGLGWGSLRAFDLRRVPCPGASPLRGLADLVLRLRIEIAGLMPLVQLARRIARDAVDHTPALHRRTFCDRVGPALHVPVFVHRQELAGAVDQALGQRAVP